MIRHRFSTAESIPASLVSLDLDPSSGRNASRALLLPLDLFTELELHGLDLVRPERQGDELVTVVASGEFHCLKLVLENIDDRGFQDGEFRAGKGVNVLSSSRSGGLPDTDMRSGLTTHVFMSTKNNQVPVLGMLDSFQQDI